MKELQLSQGYKCQVSDGDCWVSQYKWRAHVKRRVDGTIKKVYAIRTVRVNGKNTTQLMHRLILGMTDPAIEIDHKDRDGLNNQRQNLRQATTQQNQRNQGLDKSNTSGFKGVSWHSHHKKWDANIRVDNRLLHLGRFVDPIKAARAYDVAAVKHFGEFAYCNFAEAS